MECIPHAWKRIPRAKGYENLVRDSIISFKTYGKVHQIKDVLIHAKVLTVPELDRPLQRHSCPKIAEKGNIRSSGTLHPDDPITATSSALCDKIT